MSQTEHPPIRKFRLPPHNLSAEKAVIGAVLRDQKAIAICSALQPDDFYQAIHGYIWQAMLDLTGVGKRADMTSVYNLLCERKLDDDLGPDGKEYLGRLWEVAPNTRTSQAAEIILDKWAKRELERCGREWSRAAMEDSGSASELLELAMADLFAISQRLARGKAVDMHQALQSAQEEMDARIEQFNKPDDAKGAVDFPWWGLNRMTTGMHAGELIILAARPGVGKTTAALNIVWHNLKRGKKVYFASLEMTVKEILLKLIALEGGIPLSAVRSGNMRDHAVQFLDAYNLYWGLGRLSMMMDEAGGQRVMDIRANAQLQAMRGQGVDLIVADYLQLVNPGGREKNRYEQVGAITRGLKFLARELDVPVLALSQLNRASENRGDGRPKLSDLRESGNIEQDADAVMLMHLPNGPSDDQEMLDLEVAKQRHGPTGVVHLTHSKRHGKIYQLAEGEVPNGP